MSKTISLTDNDIKEIFSLFSSATKYELSQIYGEENNNYYKNINIEEVYELSQSKKEYALDAWRAIIYFLDLKGYKLKIDEDEVNLSFIKSEFI